MESAEQLLEAGHVTASTRAGLLELRGECLQLLKRTHAPRGNQPRNCAEGAVKNRREFPDLVSAIRVEQGDCIRHGLGEAPEPVRSTAAGSPPPARR